MTKIKMALALDKLIKDVKEEKILWNEKEAHTADEEESAWNRVASKNMLTGGEAKSIFKVLCKKYHQETQKSCSSWQLFESLKFLDAKHEEISNKNEIADQSATSPASNHDEETFVELLEVKDEEFSDDETSTTPSIKEDVKTNITLLNSEINNRTILKASNEKQSQKEHNNSINQHHNNSNTEKNHHQQTSRSLSPHHSLGVATIKKEKELNTGPHINALKRKYSSESNNNHHNNNNQKSDSSSDDVKHDLPEKRRLLKLSSSNSQSILNSQQQKQQQPIHDFIKNHSELKIVAVPKDIAEAAAATTTNNNNSKIPATTNTHNNSANGETNITTTTITASANENDTGCTKFSSFGSYVSTTMNRLTPKLAAKLEIKILQAIIDVNSEMMNRF